MPRSLGGNLVGSGEDRYGEVLEALPRPVRKTHYPWDVWTDGRAWRLRQGRHFAGTAEGMRSTLNTHGRSRDIAVLVVTRSATDTPRDEGRYVAFQFFPDRRYADGAPPDLFS